MEVMIRKGYARSCQLARSAVDARTPTQRLEGQGQAKRKTQHNLAREVSAKGVKVTAKPASEVMKAFPAKTRRDST